MMAGVTAGLLGVVALTGTAFAWGGGEGGIGGRADAVRDRVAEILGIERSALDDAFQQAHQEAAEAALAERLAALVEAGTITQAQADDITAWVDARPAVLDELGGVHGYGALKAGLHGFSEARLAALVEAGTITQAQADEIQAWVDARPAIVDELLPVQHGFGGRGFGRFHGHGVGPRGGHFEFRGRIGPGGIFHLPVPDVETPEAEESGTDTEAALTQA